MEIFTAEIVGGVVTVGGIVGGATKYVWDKISARQAALEQRIDAERARHEAVVADRISDLRTEMQSQDREIDYLRLLADAYIRHIVALETLVRNIGLEVPELILPRRPDGYRQDRDDRRGRRHDPEAC